MPNQTARIRSPSRRRVECEPADFEEALPPQTPSLPRLRRFLVNCNRNPHNLTYPPTLQVNCSKELSVSKFVEFPLESGGSIVIESADEPARSATGFLRGGEAGADAAHPAQGTFDASVEAIRRSADLLVSKLRGLSAPPDELEISFNLKASSEAASLVVGKGGSDANFGVLLRWRSEKAEKDDDGHSRKGSSERSSNDPSEHYKQRQRRTLATAQPATQRDDDDQDDQDDENRL